MVAEAAAGSRGLEAIPRAALEEEAGNLSNLAQFRR